MFRRVVSTSNAIAAGKISTSTVIVSFAQMRRICPYFIRCLTNGRCQLANHQARTHERTCSTCLPEHNGRSSCLRWTSHPSLHPTGACWVSELSLYSDAITTEQNRSAPMHHQPSSSCCVVTLPLPYCCPASALLLPSRTLLAMQQQPSTTRPERPFASLRCQ